jgi:nitroreductase
MKRVNMTSRGSTGGEIKEVPVDDFQARYLAHQTHAGGKRDELIALIKERHSNRRFDDKQVDTELLDSMLDVLRHCPSSCDRFGVRVKVVQDRDDKALLNGLLVGGTGWVYRAPTVLMLFANHDAYKGGDGGDELYYNSYLDAGIMAQTAMLCATSAGLHTAFINPQVRRQDREYFYERFKPDGWSNALYCGSIAIGYPHKDLIEKTRRLIDTVVVK